MKTYDIVYKLLVKDPELRSNDKKLLWRVWKVMRYVIEGKDFEYIPQQYFMSKNIPHFESIRRSRQKIQELHPELSAIESVEAMRKEKEKAKGKWIFREETQTCYKKA